MSRAGVTLICDGTPSRAFITYGTISDRVGRAGFSAPLFRKSRRFFWSGVVPFLTIRAAHGSRRPLCGLLTMRIEYCLRRPLRLTAIAARHLPREEQGRKEAVRSLISFLGTRVSGVRSVPFLPRSYGGGIHRRAKARRWTEGAIANCVIFPDGRCGCGDSPRRARSVSI